MSIFKRSGVVLLIFAIAGSYYFITRQPEAVPSIVPTIQTYADPSGVFSLTLPIDFSIAGNVPGDAQSWSADATTTGMVLAYIDVPQSYEPGTNFGDARFSVGVSADPSAVADCFKTSYGEYASSTQDTIGDTPFTKLSFSGVGAGNLYETTSYRTVRNGQCYAVEYTIHSMNIGNYPPGAVQAYDKARIQSALEAVVHSFRFLR